MSLLEQLEEDKKALKAALAQDEDQDTADTQDDKDIVEEEVKEEPKKEEPKEEPEDKRPDSELSDAEFARIRRELAAAKRKLADKEEAPKVETDTEAQQLPPVLMSIIEQHQEQMAAKELQDIEARFRRTVDDYDDVSQAYTQAMAAAIKTQNPRWSDQQVGDETRKQLLRKAAQYYADKLDPVEEMYHDAKALGFKKRVAETVQEEVKESPKPDLKKVAANKERNSGMMGTKGDGGRPDLTLTSAASMSPAAWAALPKSEKARILAQSQNVGRR